MKQLLTYNFTTALDSVTQIRGIIQKISVSSSLRELERKSLVLPVTANGYNYC